MHRVLCSFLGLVAHHRGMSWEEAAKGAEGLPGPVGEYVRGQDEGYAGMVAHRLLPHEKDACDLCCQEQKVIQFPKAGRNEPCPCGSGEKFKRCHGR